MAKDVRETVNSYITDMLALEEHIEKALDAQLSGFRDEAPEVVSRLRSVHAQCEHHIEELKHLADAREIGGARGVAEAVKRAGSAVAGLGAAAIDLIRTEKLPKNLRDDYTALSLAAIGYAMLFTTARALDANQVADLAERHLRHYAQAIMTVHDLIPMAIVKFLREDNLPVRADVLPEVHRVLDDAWRTAGAPAEGELSRAAGATTRV